MSQPPFKSCPKTIFVTTRTHESDWVKDRFLRNSVSGARGNTDTVTWANSTPEEIENDFAAFVNMVFPEKEPTLHERLRAIVENIESYPSPMLYYHMSGKSQQREMWNEYVKLYNERLTSMKNNPDELMEFLDSQLQKPYEAPQDTRPNTMIVVDDPLAFDALGWADRNPFPFDTIGKRCFLIECPEEVVSAAELHSLKEDKPHQGNPKKNYHKMNDKHNRRKRR